MMDLRWFICVFILNGIWITIDSTDIYTALVEMEALLNTEKELYTIVDLYIEAEMKRLEQVKELASNYFKSNFVTNVENAEEFLSNPINAFRLVKRLTVDCLPLLTLMNYTKIGEVISSHLANGNSFKFPDSEDLSGAAMALVRLQEIYNLSLPSMINGEIVPEVKSVDKFLANDIFEVGRQLYLHKKYDKSITWLEEALNRDKDEPLKVELKADILEHLSFNYYMIGGHSKAYEYNEELLVNDPVHVRGLANREYYKTAAENSNKNEVETIPNVDDVEEVPFHQRPEWQLTWSLYEKLCRKEVLLELKKQAQLKCYYTGKSPFLLLQPIKTEDAHLKPWLTVFYELLSDSEIDLIKNLSTYKLNRASVINKVTGEQEIANYRISKSAWLADEVHPTIYKISKRLEEVTGLDFIQGAEQLQVVNYGIGGQYDPHVDFALDDEPNSFKHLGIGNRIATVLFYMSNVEAGGATVFPQLKVGVWPKKGSAAFWFNLYKNGKGDLLTQHAACPVLVGSKWVCNKWIHEYHQEFRRPCAIEENDIYEK